MFGYVTVNKEELKIREFKRYRAYYCGLCKELGESYGSIGKLCLTYDMTFLSILLTALYEEPLALCSEHCVMRPFEKHATLRNKYTRYAADMTILLAYENRKDDWVDDKDVKQLIFMQAMKRAYQRVSEAYPRQKAALDAYSVRLKALEEAGEPNPDAASGATGDMLAEIFAYDESDVWAKDLRQLGFYLGKFIYLMDAYDDVEKDRKSGAYNPLKNYYEKPEFNDMIKGMLTLMASECARVLERLPILEDVELLRNILYSGMWAHYEEIRQKRSEDNKHDRSL